MMRQASVFEGHEDAPALLMRNLAVLERPLLEETAATGGSVRLPAGLGHVRAVFRSLIRRAIGEWAEAAIVLDAGNAEPGPLRLRRTPYMRGILEAFEDANVREITLRTSTQIGKTLCQMIELCWAIDQRPAPAMWVLPTEALARRFSRTRLMPLFRGSPTMRRHEPAEAWSVKTLEYHLDRMFLLFAWANSPAMLASQPVCYLFMDEVDKFPPAGTREADPLFLARERTRTFADHKIVKASTPTTPDGPIMREWERSDRRSYRVPCPHCGTKQVLKFAQIKWPENERDAERLRSGEIAWYECEACAGRIDDWQKAGMLAAGQWESEATSEADSTHVGFYLNALYSPWLSWGAIAGEFLERKVNVDEYRNFVNSWLGEPWEEKIAGIVAPKLEGKELDEPDRPRRGVLPDWTQVATLGVDWHGDRRGLIWVVLALGAGRRVHVVEHGQVFGGPGELDELVIQRQWKTPDGIEFNLFGGVDCRYQTAIVYDWVRGWWPQMRPAAGENEIRGKTVAESPVDYVDRATGRRYSGMARLRISTGYFKDLLAGLLVVENGEAARMTIAAGVGAEYRESLESEHKVRRRGREMWLKRPSGTPNHLLDATVIALAVGERMGWQRLAPLEEAGAPAGGGAGAAGAKEGARAESPVADWMKMRRH